MSSLHGIFDKKIVWDVRNFKMAAIVQVLYWFICRYKHELLHEQLCGTLQNAQRFGSSMCLYVNLSIFWKKFVQETPLRNCTSLNRNICIVIRFFGPVLWNWAIARWSIVWVCKMLLNQTRVSMTKHMLRFKLVHVSACERLQACQHFNLLHVSACERLQACQHFNLLHVSEMLNSALGSHFSVGRRIQWNTGTGFVEASWEQCRSAACIEPNVFLFCCDALYIVVATMSVSVMCIVQIQILCSVFLCNHCWC